MTLRMNSCEELNSLKGYTIYNQSMSDKFLKTCFQFRFCNSETFVEIIRRRFRKMYFSLNNIQFIQRE